MSYRAIYSFDPKKEAETWAPEEIKKQAKFQICEQIAKELYPLLNLKEVEIKGGLHLRSAEFFFLNYERYIELRRPLLLAFDDAPFHLKVALSEFLRSLDKEA